MRRIVALCLFLFAALASPQLAIDKGWDLSLAPPMNQRYASPGASVAAGPGGWVYVASVVSPISATNRIQIRRVTTDGVEDATPLEIGSANWDCANPRLVPNWVGMNIVTLIYERVLVTGERQLAKAEFDTNLNLTSDDAIAVVKSVAKVKVRPEEAAIYVLTTLPYYQNFTMIRLYRIAGNSISMPVSVTHQDEQTAVDFTFDTAGDVYIGSNIANVYPSFSVGRVFKHTRSGVSWPVAWHRNMGVDANTALQVGGLDFSTTTGRVIVAGNYTVSATDSRPMAAFITPANGVSWWWWGRPPDMTNVLMSHIHSVGGRVRMSGTAWDASNSNQLANKRWHYMDLDENTGYAYWWFSIYGMASANVLKKSSEGEPVAGFSQPYGSSRQWLASSPVPGVSFNGLGYDDFGGLYDLAETSDGDFVAVGVKGVNVQITKLLLPAITRAKAFDGLLEGRTATRGNLMTGDRRKNGARAVQAGATPGKTSQGGDIVVHEDGTFTYTPAPGFSGTDTFLYKAVKTGQTGEVHSAEQEVSLLVTPNQAPNANADVAWTWQDKSKLLDILANDTDPEGYPLSLTSVTDPPHGKTFIESGAVRYKPDSGYLGADTFEYTITDDLGKTATGTVTVDVRLFPVYLTSISPTSVVAGSPDLTLTLTGKNFTPGSQVLTDTTELATTFVSDTQLTALVPASMMELAAEIPVHVRNPNGAVSVTKTLTVKGTPALRPVLLSFRREPGVLVADFELRNEGTAASADASVYRAWLNAYPTTTSLPIALGAIAPRSGAGFTLRFNPLKAGTTARIKVDIQSGGVTKRTLIDVIVP